MNLLVLPNSRVWLARSVSAVVVIALMFSFTTKAEQRVELQNSDGSIAAKVEYQGDYYFDAQGNKVSVFRKKGVLVLPAQRRSRNAAAKKQSANLERQLVNHAGLLTELRKHNLPGARVVKINESGLTRESKGKRALLSDALLQSSVPELQPVFTTSTGQGDLLLLPKLTVSFSGDVNSLELLTRLQTKYGLSLVRKLAVSAPTYSLQFDQLEPAPNTVFLRARQIASELGVSWAEPQFFMQAQRAQSLVTDELFSQQWHLNNSGFRGSRSEADIHALEAWEMNNGTAPNIVIAVIDDGVQTDHPDLEIEPGGMDFVDDGMDPSVCGHDGQDGRDSNPNPSPDINCTGKKADNHGTAVAGIAAAKRDGIGAVGVAYEARILPIRAISDYELASLSNTGPLCDRLAEAVEYAAQKAHVINISWTLPLSCGALTAAIERATLGTVTVGDGSLRAGLGSPVVAASGNNASGWIKVTASVSAGEHAYEWRYLRSDAPTLDTTGFDETVWLDDITWPDGSVESFEALSDFSTGVFTTDWVVNQCNEFCVGEDGDQKPLWTVYQGDSYARTGQRSAQLIAASDLLSGEHFCGNSYLHTLRRDGAGEMSFWVWVSADTQQDSDKFEFLIDGEEVISYGDLAEFGAVDNDVAYPANLSDAAGSTQAGVIAVGASTSGDLSGDVNAPVTAEYRAPYSQFGATLDVVAPGGDQHLAITTTDRFSSDTGDTLGINTGSAADLSDPRYTRFFSGTSAAAPMVSGIAAAVIAADGTLTAQEVKDLIKNNTDPIGTTPYTMGRNDFVGHGRVNMQKAVAAANNSSVPSSKVVANKVVAKAGVDFDYQFANDLLLNRYQPQASAGMCPALGPLPEPDDLCAVIKAANNKVVTFCL